MFHRKLIYNDKYRPISRPGSWLPTDDSSQGKDAFFAQNPTQAVVKGELASKVPLIFGIAKDEGILETAKIVCDHTLLENAFVGPDSWAKCAPLVMMDPR